MKEKKMYKVAVTELLRRIVVVKARSEAEAHRRASDAWQNGEYLVLGESDGTEGKRLDHVDGKNAEVVEDGTA